MWEFFDGPFSIAFKLHLHQTSLMHDGLGLRTTNFVQLYVETVVYRFVRKLSCTSLGRAGATTVHTASSAVCAFWRNLLLATCYLAGARCSRRCHCPTERGDRLAHRAMADADTVWGPKTTRGGTRVPTHATWVPISHLCLRRISLGSAHRPAYAQQGAHVVQALSVSALTTGRSLASV